VKKLWMRRVEYQQRKKRQVQDKVSQRQRNRCGIDGDKHGVDSRHKVKHIERNDP